MSFERGHREGMSRTSFDAHSSWIVYGGVGSVVVVVVAVVVGGPRDGLSAADSVHDSHLDSGYYGYYYYCSYYFSLVCDLGYLRLRRT